MSALHTDSVTTAHNEAQSSAPGKETGVTRRLPIAAVVAGLVGVAATTFWPPHSGAEIAVLTLSVASLVGGFLLCARHGRSLRGVRVFAAAGAFAVIVGQIVSGVGYLRIHVFVVTALAAAVLASLAIARRALPLRWTVVLMLGAVVLVAASSGSVVNGGSPDIDVVALHEQAVDSLLQGENPYTTGNVQVMETKPLGDNELIEEYTYPPMNLLWYAVGDAVADDPRAGGAIALVLAVAVFALIAVHRERTGAGLVGTAALAAMALLMSNQAMYFMVVNGWTEVTALPFLFVSVLLWRRHPVASAVALGLALASKQYFVIAAPVILMLPDPRRFSRMIIASVSATATLVPFLLWDARGLIDGLIVHHLTRELRADAATWAGLGIEVPSVAAVVIAIAVGVWVVRRMHGPRGALMGIASAIAVFTLLAIRGFVNSWWLVYCVAVVGLVVPQSTNTEPGDGAGRARSAPATPDRRRDRELGAGTLGSVTEEAHVDPR